MERVQQLGDLSLGRSVRFDSTSGDIKNTFLAKHTFLTALSDKFVTKQHFCPKYPRSFGHGHFAKGHMNFFKIPAPVILLTLHIHILHFTCINSLALTSTYAIDNFLLLYYAIIAFYTSILSSILHQMNLDNHYVNSVYRKG